MPERPPHAVADRPRPQPGRRPLPPLVHAVDPRGQERVEDFYASDVSISAGFFGTLVDHTGVFGEAERFAADAQGADRTMFSVHGSSGSNWIVLRMLALERQDALVLVARNDPPLGHQRAQGLRAGLPLPADAVRAALRGAAAAERRAGRRGPAPLSRGDRGLLHVADLRGPARRTRARSSAAVHDASPTRDGVVDEAWGGHLHFHPDAARVGDGGGRRRLRAVDAQARRRPAADGADPLARGPRRLRADGGGLPRVRDDLALLPPAGVGRRGRADARGAGRGGARRGRSSAPRAEGRRCAARSPTSTASTTPAWLRSVRAHVAGLGPRQDDDRAVALPSCRATRSRGRWSSAGS